MSEKDDFPGFYLDESVMNHLDESV